MLTSVYESFVDDTAMELFGFTKKKNEVKKEAVVKSSNSYDVRDLSEFQLKKAYMNKNVKLIEMKALNAASKILPKFDKSFFNEVYKDYFDGSNQYSSSNQLQLSYKPINRTHLVAKCADFPWVNTDNMEWCIVVYVSPDKTYENIFDNILHIDPGDEKNSCYFTYAYEIGTEKEYIWRGDDKDQRILASRLTDSEYKKYITKYSSDSAMEFFGFGKKKEPNKEESREVKYEPYKASAKEINEARKELIETYSGAWDEYEKGDLMRLLKGIEFLKFIDARKCIDPEFDPEIEFHFEITTKAQETINTNGKEILVGAENCYISYIPGEGWESPYEDNQ